jgi:hypothetical protein
LIETHIEKEELFINQASIPTSITTEAKVSAETIAPRVRSWLKRLPLVELVAVN